MAKSRRARPGLSDGKMIMLPPAKVTLDSNTSCKQTVEATRPKTCSMTLPSPSTICTCLRALSAAMLTGLVQIHRPFQSVDVPLSMLPELIFVLGLLIPTDNAFSNPFVIADDGHHASNDPALARAKIQP
ncbi:MAG: hypothetical protein Q9213_001208 [Squamulea squamosa]